MVRPGEQHVVDQHDGPAGQVHRDLGGRLGQHRPQPVVVAVEGHVQGADHHLLAGHLADDLGQPGGDPHPAGLQPDQDQLGEVPVALDDLVGHAPGGPADLLGVHHRRPGNKNAPVWGRQGTFTFGQTNLLAPCRPHWTGFTG